MAGKKQMASRKQVGRTCKSNKPLSRIPTGDEPSSSRASIAEIDTAILLAPKKEKKTLFDTLPIELRLKIYQLVLNTGKFNEQTQAHVYEIRERRAQRENNIGSRKNNFIVANIRHQHSALLKTSRTIREEILALVNLRTHFIFASPNALAKRPRQIRRGPLCKPSLQSQQRELRGAGTRCFGRPS